MLRLLSTIQKELLLLMRDKGGLAIMFLMPMAMITIMAIIQDAPFRDYQELKIPLLLVNNDTGNVGKQIEVGLNESSIFEITNKKIVDENVKKAVKAGEYEIGIIIPDDATLSLNGNVQQFVSSKLSEVGLSEMPKELTNASELKIQILFTPDTKPSFKASILSSLKQSISKIETQFLLDFFTKELNKDNPEAVQSEKLKEFVTFNEINTLDTPQEALKLNSVQHNVPAWTIFGIFFIVISMAGSIIKERDDGSFLRIKTMPGSYLTVLIGKIIAYLFITIIQAFLMLLVGLYLLPLLGLPTLVIGSNILGIVIITVCTGLAATGFGVLVGTIFKTHQQASTFGAVSVVILAALGGIWVPVYVMPELVRTLSELSPLYWALTAFHKLFLNEVGVIAILSYSLKLFLFFVASLSISFFYNKSKE